MIGPVGNPESSSVHRRSPKSINQFQILNSWVCPSRLQSGFLLVCQIGNLKFDLTSYWESYYSSCSRHPALPLSPPSLFSNSVLSLPNFNRKLRLVVSPPPIMWQTRFLLRSKVKLKKLSDIREGLNKKEKTSFTSTNVRLRLRFDIHLTFTWHSPDHLTIVWPSSDPHQTLT